MDRGGSPTQPSTQRSQIPGSRSTHRTSAALTCLGPLARRLRQPFFFLGHEFVDFIDVLDVPLVVALTLDEHRQQIHPLSLCEGHRMGL